MAKKALSLEEATVTGCIKVALAMRGSGILARLRHCLWRFFQERLVRRMGHAGAEAETHRHMVMDTFLSQKTPKAIPFRTALTELLNGHWQQPVPEHWCYGCCHSRAETLEKIKQTLIKGFLGRAVRIFPRSNWLGAEETLSAVGMLVAVHNIGYSAFAACFGWGPLTSAARVEHCQAPLTDTTGLGQDFLDPDVAEPADGIHDDLEQPTEAAAGPGEGVMLPFDPAASDQKPFEGDASAEWRRQVAQARAAAKKFLVDPCSPQKLIICRRVIHPQAMMIKDLLHVASPKWEREQLVRHGSGQERDHRMLRAFHCSSTRPFLHDISSMWEADWGRMPHATVSACHLAFRMLARAAATCHRLLVRRHRHFPFRLFHLLEEHDEGFPDEVWAQPRCLFDGWTKRFLSKFRCAQDLTSDAARLRLRSILELAHTDTVSTERHHAGNLQRAKKQVTHATTVDDLAAWQALRSGVPEFYRPSKPGSRKSASAASAQQGATGPKRRAMGPWRAFVSEQTRQGVSRGRNKWAREELKSLRAAYLALPAKEKERLSEVARLQTASRNLGCKRPHTAAERKARRRGADDLDRVRKANNPAEGGGVLSLPTSLEERCKTLRQQHLEVQRADLGVSLTIPSASRHFWHILDDFVESRICFWLMHSASLSPQMGVSFSQGLKDPVIQCQSYVLMGPCRAGTPRDCASVK